jgi:beta-galactosidase
MVHIYPYWDFSPGQIIDVRVCSNAPKVELFLNGKSLGLRDIDHLHGKTLTADWRVPYEDGVLEALAYDENGQTVAKTERRSFTDAVTLKAETSVFPQAARHLMFLEISAADKQGNPVENANNRVKVTVAEGRLVGMDNGDSTDFDQYKADNRRMFNGRLLAVIEPESDKEPTFSMEFVDEDIPVRTVKLTSDAGFGLHPDRKIATVRALPLPSNATYSDFVWRLTDRASIDSPLASLAVSGDGLAATVTAKGDGAFYVRCGVKNGGEHVALYGLLAFTVTGMGPALLDPYAFVAGGLYGASNHPMTNGNERGVASLRDRESHIGFTNLDFGDYGSDELVIPVFPLSGEPFELEIWEGLPGEGGEKLQTVLYDKGSIWNTYIDFPVKLTRRLTGVTTLCFVLGTKVHIKGFTFTHYPKAFQKIHAAGYDVV